MFERPSFGYGSRFLTKFVFFFDPFLFGRELFSYLDRVKKNCCNISIFRGGKTFRMFFVKRY